jgi:uncharacterized protein YbjT (DUF2867 family)
LIVVTGATGHVGSELVAQLAAGGHPVRAVTRRPESSSFPAGVEVVYGDFDDPASLDEAMKGADRVFLMSSQQPGGGRPTQDLRGAEAARRAGARHVVKLSVFDGGAGDDAIAAWIREAEGAVVDSGMDWTLLRPGRFMSNALWWAPAIRRGDTVTIPFAHRPTASIDPADIAAVAAVALTTEGHANVVHQLSGPEVLTPAEELRILADVLHRPLELVEPSLEATRADMLAAGTAEDLVDAFFARMLSSDESGSSVLPTVAEVTGRPPRTFSDWASAHANHFLSG